jgi:hypothetical protein
MTDELKAQIENIVDERIMMILTHEDVQKELSRISVRYDSARYVSDELNAAVLKAIESGELRP